MKIFQKYETTTYRFPNFLVELQPLISRSRFEALATPSSCFPRPRDPHHLRALDARFLDVPLKVLDAFYPSPRERHRHRVSNSQFPDALL